MSPSVSVKVKPDVIKWLRESSGWTISEIGSYIEVPEETILSWEQGASYPTFNEICKMAKAFKRPSAAFFLPKPAEEPSLPQDFRRLRGASGGFSKKTMEVFRRARNLQSTGKELLENLNYDVQPDITKARLSDSPEKVAAAERDRLGVTTAEQIACKDKYKAFGMWRNLLESEGIMIFQFSMELEELRGFTIIDSAPYVIVVNSSDDIGARIFTLLHEYGHIILREPALCTPEEPTKDKHGAEVEAWCNRFSAAFLLPPDEIKADFEKTGLKQYSRTASRFKVSKYALLTRLVSLKLISDKQYMDETTRLKMKDKDQAESTGGIGETAAGRARREMGEGFVALVIENSQKGLITYSDALDYLDVKTKGLEELMK